MGLLGGLGVGLVSAVAQYPMALSPIVLLSIYSAAAILPPQRGRMLLGVGLFLGMIGATASPGPTDVVCRH